MANENKDVIRPFATEALLPTTLIPGQFGATSDTYKIGVKNLGDSTMRYWSDDSKQVLLAGAQTILGAKTFSAATIFSSTVSISGILTLSSLTANQAVFTDGSKALVSNAITGTGNVVMSASPTGTGTWNLPIANFSGNVTLNGSFPTLSINGSSQAAMILDDTGGTANQSTLQLACINDVGKIRSLTDAGGVSLDNILIFDLATGLTTSSFGINIDDTTNSTSISTGSFVIDGGAGIAKSLFMGEDIHLLDDKKVYFGTGDDVEQYFDGTYFQLFSPKGINGQDNYTNEESKHFALSVSNWDTALNPVMGLEVVSADAEGTFNRLILGGADIETGYVTVDSVWMKAGGVLMGVWTSNELLIYQDFQCNGVSSLLGAVNIGYDASDVIKYHGGTGATQQTITGSRGSNTALANLLTALALRGDIVDSTT